MINVFFDCEFTKLQQPLDPEPAELISIGCISDCGKKFYAENATTLRRPEVMSEWVKDNVIPLLDGGECVMEYSEIAAKLKAYIESFHKVNSAEGRREGPLVDGEVKLWSDAVYVDFPFVKHMFDTYGWPANLRRDPAELRFSSSIQMTRFWAGVEDAFNKVNAAGREGPLGETMQPKLRRHHALDDAVANRYAFKRATERRF